MKRQSLTPTTCNMWLKERMLSLSNISVKLTLGVRREISRMKTGENVMRKSQQSFCKRKKPFSERWLNVVTKSLLRNFVPMKGRNLKSKSRLKLRSCSATS